MLKLIQKLFGSSSQRTLKNLRKEVKHINQVQEKLKNLTHDQLRQKTIELKQHIKQHTLEEQNTITQLKQQARTQQNITKKNKLFNQLQKAEKDLHDKTEKILLELLPQAFALIKETTKRFKENQTIVVEATQYDKILAKKHKYVKVVDHQAHWQNTWKAGGQTITWNMVPYDVQLMGGIVLHQGKIAEMATGEGKTLAAILPTFLNALTEKGVHIVTVNNYLSQRDAEWVGPIYQFHGLTVDCIDKHPPHTKQRKQAYLADITYGTSNEFGFDYLRDNMVTMLQEKVQRLRRNMIIIDEVDSVAIDEARTPLIISGPASYSDTESYYLFKPRVQKLFKTQEQLIKKLFEEAQQQLAQNNTKQAGLALLRIYRGLPKHKPFVEYLSEKGIKKLLSSTEDIYLEDNSKRMPEVDEPLYFIIEEKHNTIELTEKGIEYLTQQDEDPNFFILPDMATKIANIENNTKLNTQEKIKERNNLLKEYSKKSTRLHTINQLLKAYTLFERDIHYVIMNNQVKIVDEQTGRILPGRRYSNGQHQAIEAKENVTIQNQTQTYATTTLQNYFRLFPKGKVAGMTGTAVTEAKLFLDIYGLHVVAIPTHKPVIRKDKDDKVYKTKEEKIHAIVEETNQQIQVARAVLIGTCSVESSEEIAREITKKLGNQVKVQVLNAKHHQKEAEIVAKAGEPGVVTIATNMAGRGTDIKLHEKVKQAGGLAIIITEHHESKRVDEQFIGRAGRQGDPGTSQFFVSTEDQLYRFFNMPFMAKNIDKIFPQKGEAIQDPLITKALRNAQKRVEENTNAGLKRLFEYDKVDDEQRKIFYQRRDHALQKDQLDLDIMKMIYSSLYHLVEKTQTTETKHKSFELDIIDLINTQANITPKELENQTPREIAKKLYEKAYNTYLLKKESLRNQLINILKQQKQPTEITLSFSISPTENIYTNINLTKDPDTNAQNAVTSIESSIVLHYLDQYWKNHLQRMDELKEASKNAVYEQKDPLLIYKFEALELFKEFTNNSNKKIISTLFKIDQLITTQNQAITTDPLSTPSNKLQEIKQDFTNQLSDTPIIQKPNTPIRSKKVANRNQRVNVQYTDGTIKKNIKFKTIQQDVEQKRCIII